jgi:hypothetical protein
MPASVASAQDFPLSATPQIPFSQQHFAVDGSALFTSLGDRSLDLNGTFAPFGDINESGFRIGLSGSASWYRFITNQNPLTLGSGHSFETSMLAGYEFSMNRVSFTGLIGPTVAESDDEGVSRSRWGAKTALSMYARPTDATMAFTSFSYSTIANFLQLQAKVGAKLVGDFFIGPEASFSWRNVESSDNRVAVTRVGGHISAGTFGPFLVGLSAGWAHQQQLGSGYYGSANFYLTF